MQVTQLSVQDLTYAKEAASRVVKQFPLRPARVKAIIKSIEKHNQFLSTFSVAVFEDTMYLVGGRHRLQALVEMIKSSEDGTVLEATADDAVFPAVVYEVETLADVALLTELDNDTRSMTQSEKQYLDYTFESTLEGNDYAVNSASRLRTAYLAYEISHPTLTTDTIRQIWGAFIRGLSAKQRKVLTKDAYALADLSKSFECELVHAAKSCRTPARDYKKVAGILLSTLTATVPETTQENHNDLTKQDKEDVAILGAALERSLKSEDKLFEARQRQAQIEAAIEKESKSVVFRSGTPDDEVNSSDDDEFGF